MNNLPMVFLNDLMTDIESQSGTLTNRLCGKKGLEDILFNGGIDTGTTVLTGENNIIGFFLIAGREDYPAALSHHCWTSILYDIDGHLAQMGKITLNGWNRPMKFLFDLNIGTLDLAVQNP